MRLARRRVLTAIPALAVVAMALPATARAATTDRVAECEPALWPVPRAAAPAWSR